MKTLFAIGVLCAILHVRAMVIEEPLDVLDEGGDTCVSKHKRLFDERSKIPAAMSSMFRPFLNCFTKMYNLTNEAGFLRPDKMKKQLGEDLPDTMLVETARKCNVEENAESDKVICAIIRIIIARLFLR